MSTRYGAVQERVRFVALQVTHRLESWAQIMRATDRRVTLVNELFGAIRTIKFAGASPPAVSRVLLRRDESRSLGEADEQKD